MFQKCKDNSRGRERIKNYILPRITLVPLKYNESTHSMTYKFALGFNFLFSSGNSTTLSKWSLSQEAASEKKNNNLMVWCTAVEFMGDGMTLTKESLTTRGKFKGGDKRR